jgi:hypothetical protein
VVTVVPRVTVPEATVPGVTEVEVVPRGRSRSSIVVGVPGAVLAVTSSSTPPMLAAGMTSWGAGRVLTDWVAA